MNAKILLLVALACVLSACGKDEEKTAGEAGAAAVVVQNRDFKSITGVSAAAEAQNACPYEELAGSYKIGSSECTLNGNKAALDNFLVPTRYSIFSYEADPSTNRDPQKGGVEIKFTGDGQEVQPLALDFPKVQNAASAKKMGVQCTSDPANGNLILFHACVGGSVTGRCFYSIVQKDDKLTAVVSQVKGGLQYVCRSKLRKVETVEQ